MFDCFCAMCATGSKIIRCAGVPELTKRDKENFDAFNTQGNIEILRRRCVNLSEKPLRTEFSETLEFLGIPKNF